MKPGYLHTLEISNCSHKHYNFLRVLTKPHFRIDFPLQTGLLCLQCFQLDNSLRIHQPDSTHFHYMTIPV